MYDLKISKLNSFEITVGSGLVAPSNFSSMSDSALHLLNSDSDLIFFELFVI